MTNPFGRGKRQVGDNTTKRLAQSVKVARPPTTADTHDPKTGKPFIKGTFWIVDQNPSSGAEGDLYYLKYNDVSSATWAAVLTGAGASAIDSLTTDSGTALPDSSGDVDILGGTNIATSATGDAVTINIDGTIGASNGGTGQSTYSEFDLLVGNSSGGLDRSSQIDTAVLLPDGADGDRPGTPSNGLIRYSTTNNCIEAYVNGAWVCLYDTGDTIPVEDGGTGASTLTGIITGNGTSPFTASTVTEGAVLLGGSSNLVSDTGVLTKGDIIVGDGVTDPVLLGVGSDGQVLTADSGEASGVKWADPVSGDTLNDLGSVFQIWTDFAGGTQGSNDQGMTLSTQSGGGFNVKQDGDHPGIYTMRITTANGYTSYFQHKASGSTYDNFVLGSGIWTSAYVVRCTPISDGTDDYTAYIGHKQDTTITTTVPTDGAFFRYNHAVNSGNWEAVTESGSTETTTDTGVAGDTDWHNFRIVVNAAVSQVLFYLDGSLVATHTTNISSNDFVPHCRIINNAGTGQRDIDMDFMAVRCELTNARTF